MKLMNKLKLQLLMNRMMTVTEMHLYNIINKSKKCCCCWNGSCPKDDDKEKTLGTVKGIARSLNDRLTSLTAGVSLVILVLDTYKPDSLKNKTRER